MLETLHEVRLRLILERLDIFKGHRGKAATSLGITERTLYRVLNDAGEFESRRLRRTHPLKGFSRV